MRHQSLTNFTLEALARCKRLMGCAVAILGAIALGQTPAALARNARLLRWTLCPQPHAAPEFRARPRNRRRGVDPL